MLFATSYKVEVDLLLVLLYLVCIRRHSAGKIEHVVPCLEQSASNRRMYLDQTTANRSLLYHSFPEMQYRTAQSHKITHRETATPLWIRGASKV